LIFKMPIPLQSVNIRQQPNPFLSVEQIASGLQNMRAQAAQIKMHQAQQQAQMPLTQAQAAYTQAQAQAYPQQAQVNIARAQAQQRLLEAQAQAQQQKQQMLAKYPATAFGAPGQALALGQYLQSQQPQGVPQQGQQPQQAGIGKLGQAQVPQPVEQQQSDSLDPESLANQSINTFKASLQPNKASDYGIQLKDPHQQALLDSAFQKAFPSNYAQYAAKQWATKAFSLVPSTMRGVDVAKLRGLGLSSTTAGQYLASGRSPLDLAKSMGLNKDEFDKIAPAFAPTTATLSRVQEQNMRTQAYDAVNNVASRWLTDAGYTQTVAGVSPKQIYDLVLKQTSDRPKIARALAASAVQPELALMRGTAFAGRMNQKLIDEIQNSALGRLKTFQGLVAPKTYQMMQQNLTNLLRIGTGVAQSFLTNPNKTLTPSDTSGLSQQLGGGSSVPSAPEGMVAIKDKNGNVYHIKKEYLESAKKSGGVVVNG